MTDRAAAADFKQAQRKWASNAEKRSPEWGEATARSLWENLYAPWIDAVDGRSFLDIGCSWGYLFQYMLDRHRPGRLVGVDVVAHWEEAPYDWQSDARAPIEFHHGNIFDAVLEEESFDYILCAGMLMYLPPAALRATLHRMRDLLRPGGELLVRTQTFTSYLGLQVHRTYEVPYVHLLHGERVLRDRIASNARSQPSYTNWLTPTSYLSAFSDAGFEILDVRRFPNPHSPEVQDRVLAEFPASHEEMSVSQLAARLARPIALVELDRFAP